MQMRWIKGPRSRYLERAAIDLSPESLQHAENTRCNEKKVSGRGWLREKTFPPRHSCCCDGLTYSTESLLPDAKGPREGTNSPRNSIPWGLTEIVDGI